MLRKTFVFLFWCFSYFCFGVWLSRINESLLLFGTLWSAADKGHCVAAALPIPIDAENMPASVHDGLPSCRLLPSSGRQSVQTPN